ncbi:MAG: DUF6498-containing protein [Aquimonas sp.]|nr:DUF6498-containing protein [Aquimonas sp.]
MSASASTTDRALWAILGSNALTAVVALVSGWGLLQLLWPFWIQSVVIGWFAMQRILKLQAFCTEGFRINQRPVEATPVTRTLTAVFFALHYGFFHFIYFAFLAGFTAAAAAGGGSVAVTDTSSGEVTQVAMGQVRALDWLLFAALGFVFWRSHGGSHREHVEADLAGRPNIGTLMFMPYLRILPMHLTLILGMLLSGGGAVLLFLGLKTAADVGMHRVEHALLRREKTR